MKGNKEERGEKEAEEVSKCDKIGFCQSTSEDDGTFCEYFVFIL